MLLALSHVTYVLIGWFKFLLLKFLYEYRPWYKTKKLVPIVHKNWFNRYFVSYIHFSFFRCQFPIHLLHRKCRWKDSYYSMQSRYNDIFVVSSCFFPSPLQYQSLTAHHHPPHHIVHIALTVNSNIILSSGGGSENWVPTNLHMNYYYDLGQWKNIAVCQVTLSYLQNFNNHKKIWPSEVYFFNFRLKRHNFFIIYSKNEKNL